MPKQNNISMYEKHNSDEKYENVCVYMCICVYMCKTIPANTRHSPNVGTMLAHRLRRWSNIGWMSRVCWDTPTPSLTRTCTTMCNMSHEANYTVQSVCIYFHPLEVVSRWRDPQLQVSENTYGLDLDESSLPEGRLCNQRDIKKISLKQSR